MTANRPGLLNEGKPLLTPLLLLTISLCCTKLFPAFWQTALCAPTSVLAASWLHAPCTSTSDGYLIHLPGLAVRVTQACNATQFLSLLWALMASVGLARGTRPRPVGTLSPGPRLRTSLATLAGYAVLAYAVTILANTARVIVGWWAGLWARRLLPESFHPGVHLAVGIIVFTAFLVGGYVLATWLSRPRVIPCHGVAACVPLAS